MVETVDNVINRPKQRFARLLHLVKARYRAKERNKVLGLSRFVPPESTIVDVGAHFGYFAKEFARLHAHSCHVICFEPFSYNRGILESVMSGHTNCTIVPAGLSDRSERVPIYVPVKTSGRIGPGLAHMGEEVQRSSVSEIIDTLRFDEWISQHDSFPPISFLKCDIEGAELLALQGAQRCLSKDKPALFIEINEAYTRRMGYEPKALFDYLLAMRYQGFQFHPRNGGLTRVDAYRGSSDYLFVHGSQPNAINPPTRIS